LSAFEKHCPEPNTADGFYVAFWIDLHHPCYLAAWGTAEAEGSS